MATAPIAVAIFNPYLTKIMRTTIIFGILFFLRNLSILASDLDPRIQKLAERKIAAFHGLMGNLASPDLGSEDKNRIENLLKSDFLASKDVQLINNLSISATGLPIKAESYLSRLRALYPNGAKFNFTPKEISKPFFEKSSKTWNLIFRNEITFSGRNVLGNEDVHNSDRCDLRLGIFSKDDFMLRIISEGGALGKLKDARKNNSEPATMPVLQEAALYQEEALIVKAENLIQELNKKAVDNKQNGKEPELSEAEKTALANELKRAKSELRKEKKMEASLGIKRLNMRFGFGYTIADSAVNSLAGIVGNIRSSWLVKTDLQYKIGGFQNAARKNLKTHTAGIFLQYGKQSAANVERMMRNSDRIDLSKASRGFLEMEAGLMLREELRISGGAGLMNYYRIAESGMERATKTYYCFTGGLASRLLPFLEIDLNLGAVVIDSQLKPRAGITAVVLLKAM